MEASEEVIENTEAPKISQDPPDNQVQNKENLLDPEIKLILPKWRNLKVKFPSKRSLQSRQSSKNKKGKGGELL